LVDRVMKGELDIKQYITHNFTGIESWPKALEALKGGDCLRAVVTYGDAAECGS
jgi:S-(hydroxymethyl)glutathione dehydrogenase/alcohol dehydrogenase